MKICSWNVYLANKRLGAICGFIERNNFDIVCLQEVSPALLSRLQTLPYNLVSGIDVLDVRGNVGYVAILSKYPVLKSLSYPVATLPPIGEESTRLIDRAVRTLLNWHPMKEKTAVYADVEVEGKCVRIFSVHLTISSPHARKEEFARTLELVEDAIPTIIAGDLNIFSSPFFKMASWLIGATFREGLPWHSERTQFDEAVSSRGFANPLRRIITHVLTFSQLDHILLSKEFQTRSAGVSLRTFGSDHRPAIVTANVV